MAMFQFFKRVDGQYPGSKLLDPQGALAQEVPSRAISVANTEVALLQQAGGAKVVDMIYTDHPLNVESGHPFQVACVNSCS